MGDPTLSDFRDLSRAPPTDPDIQATLSDFLTYTEHFPSHLVRALTLIHERRSYCEEKIRSVHLNTAAYSVLPSIKESRPDPIQLRRDISNALARAEAASRMSVEEAARMADECEMEEKRLKVVVQKLKAQPMPPSRDPTPEPQALTSPNLKRERGVSSRGEELRAEKYSRHLHDRAASKLRGRKIIVPGEVLPPPDPNAPVESISEWSSPEATPAPAHQNEVNAGSMMFDSSPRQRSRTPRAYKPPRDRERHPNHLKPRGPRAPGQPGTNAHSAVAGISTSNALLALTKPPDDAVMGSKWLPWIKLTEWEMAKLRKRMKKNAIWVPSQTMIRRELKNLGRGIAAKDAARAHSEATGAPFLDEHNEPDPTTLAAPGKDPPPTELPVVQQGYADNDDIGDDELVNRGMRLNEAKKLKRQRILEEQALQAQIEREAGVDDVMENTETGLTAPETNNKRKRDSSPPPVVEALNSDDPNPLTKPGLAMKKPKITRASSPGLTASAAIAPVPVKMGASPKIMPHRNRRAATPPATRQHSLVLHVGKAVSEEPPNRRASLRRSSTASMPSASVPSGSTRLSPRSASPVIPKLTTRRSRRPAPGVITNNDEGSAKVGVSQRKAAPRKRGMLRKDSSALLDAQGDPVVGSASSAADTQDEYIDPSEPRYCICGDVSWGTMIACDNNDDCEKEWFHLECVNLSGMPPRRTKWYCPDCRKKLKLGQTTHGLVGRNVGPQGR